MVDTRPRAISEKPAARSSASTVGKLPLIRSLQTALVLVLVLLLELALGPVATSLANRVLADRLAPPAEEGVARHLEQALRNPGGPHER